MTEQIYKKYGRAFIVSTLLLWTILAPSHFQKGGIETKLYFGIALFVTVISVFTNLLVDKFNWVEKVLVSIPFAFVSLLVTTLLLGPKIVELFYSDKTWFLWETKHRIFINAVYYGLNAIILALLANIYFTLRGLLKARKKTKGTYG